MKIEFIKKDGLFQRKLKVGQLMICLVGIAEMGLLTASTRLRVSYARGND